MKNEEMAADICGRICESGYNKEYNAMYLACMEAMEWKDAQAAQDRDIIRKHWQRWAEEREEKKKNNDKDEISDRLSKLRMKRYYIDKGIGFQTTSEDLAKIDEEIKKLECLVNEYDN